MKYGLYSFNGLIDTCHEPSEQKARATFRRWYGLSSLRGYWVYKMNEEDGWYADNYDAIQSARTYKQEVIT